MEKEKNKEDILNELKNKKYEGKKKWNDRDDLIAMQTRKMEGQTCNI